MGCGVDFYQAVDFGHFEEAGDHFGDTGQVKGSASGFKAGEAIYDSSQACAVDFCGFGEIEDDAGLFFAQKIIHGLSQAHAFDAGLKLSFQLQGHDAGSDLFSGDFHAGPPRIGTVLLSE